MGKTLLVCRLAGRDVRHHLAQAVLLVVAIAAATATLTMALALNGVTSQPPYTATRAATKGPDVVAYFTSTSQVKELVKAPGSRSTAVPSRSPPGSSASTGAKPTSSPRGARWSQPRSTSPWSRPEPGFGRVAS
jgi:hypothetical protein